MTSRSAAAASVDKRRGAYIGRGRSAAEEELARSFERDEAAGCGLDAAIIPFARMRLAKN